MIGEKGISFVLASASPRRRELLAQWGFKFVVVTSDVDEAAFAVDQISPVEYAGRLALAKAKNVAEKNREALVVGADTIADFAGQIIGKPANAEEARLIVTKLFSAPHKVVTAVAIVRLADNVEVVESDSTVVYPRRLTEKQIAAHIDSQCWQDKAGAYAIKECGDEFIEKIEGSVTNVMGMPMELFQRMLEKIAERKV